MEFPIAEVPRHLIARRSKAYIAHRQLDFPAYGRSSSLTSLLPRAVKATFIIVILHTAPRFLIVLLLVGRLLDADVGPAP